MPTLEKNIINRLPALKFLMIFMCGFFIFNSFDISLYISITLVFLLILMIILFYKQRLYLKVYLSGVLLISLLFVKLLNNNELSDRSYYDRVQRGYFSGKIDEVISQTKINSRVVLEGTLNPKYTSSIKTRILAYIRLNNGPVAKGDYFYGEIEIQHLSNRKLWFEFPSKLYAKSKDSEFVTQTSEWKSTIIRLDDVNLENEKILFGIKSFILNNYSDEIGGLAYALITGQKKEVPNQIRQQFNQTGTSHVLALSGLHIGIIAFMIFKLISFIPYKWLKFIVFNLVLLIFLWITGFQTSSIRAYIIISLYIMISNIERVVEPLNLLSVASLIMLFIEPEMIYSISFQLSFSAVFSILIFYDVIKVKLLKYKIFKGNFGEFFVSSLAISTSAFIGVTPVSCYYFGYFSFLSIPANMIVVPIVSLAIIYLLLALVLSPILSISPALCLMSELLLRLSITINKHISGLPNHLIDNQLALSISVALAISLIYIISSRSIRIFLFRSIVSMIVLLMIIIQKPNHTYFIDNAFSKLLISDNIVAMSNIDNMDSKKSIKVVNEIFKRGYYDDIRMVVLSSDKNSINDDLKYRNRVESISLKDHEIENTRIYRNYFQRKYSHK